MAERDFGTATKALGGWSAIVKRGRSSPLENGTSGNSSQSSYPSVTAVGETDQNCQGTSGVDQDDERKQADTSSKGKASIGRQPVPPLTPDLVTSDLVPNIPTVESNEKLPSTAGQANVENKLGKSELHGNEAENLSRNGGAKKEIYTSPLSDDETGLPGELRKKESNDAENQGVSGEREFVASSEGKKAWGKVPAQNMSDSQVQALSSVSSVPVSWPTLGDAKNQNLKAQSPPPSDTISSVVTKGAEVGISKGGRREATRNGASRGRGGARRGEGGRGDVAGNMVNRVDGRNGDATRGDRAAFSDRRQNHGRGRGRGRGYSADGMSARGAYMGGRYGNSGNSNTIRGPGEMQSGRGPYMGSVVNGPGSSATYISGMNPPPMGVAGGIAYYYARPPVFYPPGPYPPNIALPANMTTQASLLSAIGRQVEYYFSQENLVRDIFLRNNMNSSGWIPLTIIANFNRLRMLTQDPAMIVEALKESQVVEFSTDNSQLRKRIDWESWVLPDTESESENAGLVDRELSMKDKKKIGDEVFSLDEEVLNEKIGMQSENVISDEDVEKLMLVVEGEHEKSVTKNGIIEPDLAKLINKGLEFYQRELEKERENNRTFDGEHFYPGSLHDQSDLEGRRDGRHEADGTGVGWIMAHTPEQRKSVYRPASMSEEMKPLPELEHPGIIALEDKGFKQKCYIQMLQQCFDERKSDEHEGTCGCKNIQVLYRFWSYFLRSYFNRKMYNDFCTFAIQNAKDGDHFGVECLFRYYSYGLANRFRMDLFNDFQDYAITVADLGNQYGLEKLRAFYTYFPHANSLTLKDRVAQFLKSKPN